MKQWMRLVCGLWVALGFAAEALARGEVGDDVVAAFARAERGEPLRYVAIGGSITQASGPGWVGDWLREQFPKSEVTVINSGISGTSSGFGIFRAERDIIAHQPDLVAIEFCVNDGALTDEQAVRYMETLVVRLKSLPHPPAIVIVESAADYRVNLERHRRVARHYGLAEVDMQAAVDARLAARGEDWSVLFSDNVHPNREGHAFYAETMRGVLAPFVARARAEKDKTFAAAPLPAPLSTKPLLLDARMVALRGLMTPDWKLELPQSQWWSQFFQGLLTAEQPGATLRVPFRGTMVGAFFTMNEKQGSFFVNVNGDLPRHVYTNTRSGFMAFNIATDLPPREHMLTLVLPAKSETDPRFNGPVRLGYLLVAGESEASRERSPQGAFTAEAMRDLVFLGIDAAAWSWTGPFKVLDENGAAPVDAIKAIGTKFRPEPGDADFDAAQGEWKAASGQGALVDLRDLSGDQTATVAYAKTTFDAGEGGEAILSVTIDYYAQLWLNGERVLVFDGPHPRPFFMPVKLRPGANEFFLKTGAGSAGHSFEISVALPKIAR